MTKTMENMQGVKGVISLARKINPEIGMYQEYFLNENFGYSARLTNNYAIAMSGRNSRRFHRFSNVHTASMMIYSLNYRIEQLKTIKIYR